MKIKNRRWKKRIMTVCAAAAAAVLSLGYAVPAQAADGTYKISFKAGSKGIFTQDIQDVSSTGTSVTRSYPYQSVISAEDLAVIESAIDAEAGYYFTGWSPQIETVTKKANYVAQYARIINEAVYRVNYIDTYGNAVATQKVASTELGQTVSERCPQIEGYTADAQTKTAVISKANGVEITFTYTQTENAVTETQTVTVPGETVTTIVGGTTPATPAAPTQTEGTAPGGTTPEGETPGTVVESEDEEVPLADQDLTGEGEQTEDGTAQEPSDEIVRSEDDEVPLASQRANGIPSGVYAAGAATVLALAGVVVYLYQKKKSGR